MTPSIVSKDGKVMLITGSPGGRTIMNTVFTVVLAVTEFGMKARDDVDATRLHHQWLPDSVTIERGPASDALAGKLRALGHTVTIRGAQGDANSILVDAGGTAWGANDKRNADGKVSVAGARLTSTAAKRSLSRRCRVSRTSTGTIIPAAAGRSTCAADTRVTRSVFQAPPDRPTGLFLLY